MRDFAKRLRTTVTRSSLVLPFSSFMHCSLALLATEKHGFLRVTKCVPLTQFCLNLSLVLLFACPFFHCVLYGEAIPDSSNLGEVPPQLPLYYYNPYLLLGAPSFLLASKLRAPRSCQAMGSFLAMQPWSSPQCRADNKHLQCHELIWI